MMDIIFNVQQQTQGPTIWLPLIGYIPFNSPLVGSFLGVIAAFAFNYAWQFLSGERLKFEEEFHIKAELSGIEHDFGVGGRPFPIMILYGADHVIKYRLFGLNRTQVILWYEGLKRYNFEFEELQEDFHNNYSKILANQDKKKSEMGCILASQWLKRIPSDFNLDKLTRTKFIWYLLKQDALEEPTRDGDYKQAIEDNAVKTIKGYISRIYGWFQIWK